MATNNVGNTISTDGIIKAISEASKKTDAPVSQKDTATVLSLLKTVVGDALKTGEKVQLTGFVTFAPSYRAARKGNNVKTNEPMDIPESVVVSIKAGKSLKDAVHDMDAAVVKAVKGEKKTK